MADLIGPIDLQTQIYILSGVFGGVNLILLIIVFVLLAQISSLKKLVNTLRTTSRLSTHGTPIPRRKPDGTQQNSSLPVEPDLSSRFAQYPAVNGTNDPYSTGYNKVQYQDNPAFASDPRYQNAAANRASIDPRYLQYRTPNGASNATQNPGYARSNTSVTYSKY